MAGTHDVQRRYGTHPDSFMPTDAFSGNSGEDYRIREKVATITVEMPRPVTCLWHYSEQILLQFATPEQRDAALAAIKSAMEKA